MISVRDRPFNLKGGGGGGGGYGFLLRSEIFFRTTRNFFFQNLTLGYMTKTLNQATVSPKVVSRKRRRKCTLKSYDRFINSQDLRLATKK